MQNQARAGQYEGGWGCGDPQWAKIMVHSTLIEKIYENGQIYEQNID